MQSFTARYVSVFMLVMALILSNGGSTLSGLEAVSTVIIVNDPGVCGGGGSACPR